MKVAMVSAGHEVTLRTRRASRLPFTGECSDFLRDHWATARYSWHRIAADTIRAYPVAAPEPVTAWKPRSRAEAR